MSRGLLLAVLLVSAGASEGPGSAARVDRFLKTDLMRGYRHAMRHATKGCAPEKRPNLAKDLASCSTYELRAKQRPHLGLRVYHYKTEAGAAAALEGAKSPRGRGFDAIVTVGSDLYWLTGDCPNDAAPALSKAFAERIGAARVLHCACGVDCKIGNSG